ncbi:MAG TPA: biopolymer transporter ExbD [Terrimicrobiaceae bacterium]|jgi:biopolymer transport protein ExbD
MRIHSEPDGNLEFQIAPMVDVIFILILFFMCSAGATKVENELSLKLPGRISQDQPMRMLDEQIIEIDEGGQIILNNQEMNTSALGGTLQRYKAISDDAKSGTVITILTAKNTKYQRIIDVLNECAAAKIESVTFMTRPDENKLASQ